MAAEPPPEHDPPEDGPDAAAGVLDRAAREPAAEALDPAEREPAAEALDPATPAPASDEVRDQDGATGPAGAAEPPDTDSGAVEPRDTDSGAVEPPDTGAAMPPAGRRPRARRAQTTMNDLAVAAGVSLKTVSRVINGEPGVTPETLRKVEQAIEVLGYQRNDLAASLRSGVGSNTIGLVIEDVANPFYARVAQAVEDIAREHASLLITTSAREDPQRERELVGALLRRRVDALLIVPAGPDHRYVADAGFAGRSVFLDRPPARMDADTVLVENLGGAERAVAHLLRQGHRRIAIVGDTHALYTAGERLAGYTRALQRAGLTAVPELVSMGHSTWEDAHAAVLRLLELPEDRRPTAIFAANNRCTIGAMHALHGIEQDVALIGFDEFELADLLGVTVVRTDPYRIGQVAARLAFDRIGGEERPPQRVVLPVDLIVRGSGERPVS